MEKFSISGYETCVHNCNSSAKCVLFEQNIYIKYANINKRQNRTYIEKIEHLKTCQLHVYTIEYLQYLNSQFIVYHFLEFYSHLKYPFRPSSFTSNGRGILEYFFL